MKDLRYSAVVFETLRLCCNVVGSYYKFLSFMVIYVYGEQGFIKTRFWKYFFYAFYPVHMLIIFFCSIR